MIDERIAARRRAVRDQRRRHRLRRTAAGAVLAVSLLVAAAIERSDLVALRTIEVAGNARVREADVIAAADLRTGTSTLRLRLGRAATRIEALPLVRSAEVVRVGPRAVRVTVEEREAALVVRGGGRTVLVDREGAVIDVGELDGLPVVELATPPPAVGEGVSADASLANAYVAWRGLSGPLRVRVVRYDATRAEDLTLWLADGIEVRFGRAERVDEKVRALGAILADLGDVAVAAIDVRSPTAPVVLPR